MFGRMTENQLSQAHNVPQRPPTRSPSQVLWAHDRVHNITETGPPVLTLNLDLHLPNLVLYSSLPIKSTIPNTKVFIEFAIATHACMHCSLVWLIITVWYEISTHHPIGRIFILYTPWGIQYKYSPNFVSCRIGFSTIYTSMGGQTCQLQGQWPWWQRTFLGRMNPKSHGGLHMPTSKWP
jgi:hypothetical protein